MHTAIDGDRTRGGRKLICVKKVPGATRGEMLIRVVLEDGTELEASELDVQGGGRFRSGGNDQLGVFTWFETTGPVALDPPDSVLEREWLY